MLHSEMGPFPETYSSLPEDFPWTESMLGAFFRQYLETALWSSMDESDESGGEPLDANYSIEDIPQDVRDRLRAECIDFIADNASDLEYWTDAWGLREGSERAGQDFWLTRCYHGAWFWDRFRERQPTPPGNDFRKRPGSTAGLTST